MAAPEAATGTVVVRTVPSGASVKLRGRVLLSRGGSAYSLPVGTHTLEIVSAGGESTRRAVSVTEGGTLTLCHNFDANAPCD